MDSEIHDAGTEVSKAETGTDTGAQLVPETAAAPDTSLPIPAPGKNIRWVFIGPQGLRAGWSTAIFASVFLGTGYALQALAKLAAKMAPQGAAGSAQAHAKAAEGMTPLLTILGEGAGVIFLLLVILLMALIEHRHPADYNLREKRLVPKFLSGIVAGFAALSALVGVMSLGGWMHFGLVALTGWQVASYAGLWALAFLLVGLLEEGMCRCYLQFTLARGINFWWALGLVALLCLSLLRHHGGESWGVYGFALAGLAPCLWLYLTKKSASSSFWYAAWATSTFFGWIHTSNNGENWIGIFAAALIGFVFCASIWATGSAWWAIGCHAAWDWAESYFYGTADSGMVAKGHLLTTNPSGNALWSGGADGPEGSLLVIPIVLLLLVVVLVQYGRSKRASEIALEPQP